jgi:hypothetical protein
MKKISIPVIYTLLVTIGITVAFMGCTGSDSNTQKKKIEETDMPIETLTGFFEERISVTEILNDSVIYKIVNRDTASPQPMGPSAGGTSYYRQYFDSGEKVKLGTIRPFIIGMGEPAIVDNVLYFCVTSADEDGQENNNLYGIDFEKNQLNVYYTDNEVIPIMEIFAYQDKLLFWKTKKREGDSANTYFEIYDPKDGNTKKVNNHTVNHSAKTSPVIMTCFVNGDTVYA